MTLVKIECGEICIIVRNPEQKYGTDGFAKVKGVAWC